MSQIEHFYAGQTIFVTGGTGFLGKILIEKLLRSCPQVKTVYVLIRAKKGKSVQERIESLLTDAVFEVLRDIYPDFAKKIVGVNGDIVEERLGLSDTDYKLLINEVSFIFHLAATVRFAERIDKAIAINVIGAKYIVDIAKACKNLKAGMHISTAYSHCIRKKIDEELYPPPASYEEVCRIFEDAKRQNLSGDELEVFTQKAMGEWPNTYTFTKAVAEGVVAEFAKDLPFAIFRPSIVMPPYREPIPGWVNGPIGLAGLLCTNCLGITHANLIDLDCKGDVVPVDYVCNALITCAWETATTPRPHDEDVPVYNYVSGPENPITWRTLLKDGQLYNHICPSNKTVYYPFLIYTKWVWLFNILHFFLHLMPALMVDIGAMFIGKNTKFYKTTRTFESLFVTLGYFTLREWDFGNHRIQSLWKRIEHQDRAIFPFNVNNLDWDEQLIKIVKGIPKFLTGEPDVDTKQARRRLFYFYIVHVTVLLVFGFSVLWVVWKLFCGRI